jgi:hypothetical protein
MAVTGEDGELVIRGTLTFENASQLVLNSADSQIRGSFDFKDSNVVDAQEDVNIKSSIGKWNNSQIKVTAGKTLKFSENEWYTKGTLTKTGGSMSLENMEWTLSGDTSYTSDTEIKIKTLLLNDHILALGSADSDIEVTDNLTFNNSNEGLKTRLADITLENSISLKHGPITSTGGIVYLKKRRIQSRSELEVNRPYIKNRK